MERPAVGRRDGCSASEGPALDQRQAGDRGSVRGACRADGGEGVRGRALDPDRRGPPETGGPLGRRAEARGYPAAFDPRSAGRHSWRARAAGGAARPSPSWRGNADSGCWMISRTCSSVRRCAPRPSRVCGSTSTTEPAGSPPTLRTRTRRMNRHPAVGVIRHIVAATCCSGGELRQGRFRSLQAPVTRTQPKQMAGRSVQRRRKPSGPHRPFGAPTG